MRKANSQNKKMKYVLSIKYDGNEVHSGEYTSLREVSKELCIPYHTICDYYEGRRKTFGRFSDCKFFPTIDISKKDSDYVDIKDK